MAAPSLSIFYAVMRIFVEAEISYGCRDPREGAWEMYPFVASQAIALQHAIRKPDKQRITDQPITDPSPPVPAVRKGLFRRILDVLVESRRRRADLEIQRQQRWIESTGNKEDDRVS
jgi:hypothetical protein